MHRGWRLEGIAYEIGDQVYDQPNRTMISYAEGMMVKGKHRGLRKEMRSVEEIGTVFVNVLPPHVASAVINLFGGSFSDLMRLKYLLKRVAAQNRKGHFACVC